MRSFAASMFRWAKDTSETTQRTIRGATLVLFTAVIRDTPVDTGRLRSNWRCSIGNPNYDEQSDVSKGGVAAIQETMSTVDLMEMDETIILCNNLPYAYRIEYEGYSREKSPQGMVRRNAIRINSLLKRRLASQF